MPASSQGLPTSGMRDIRFPVFGFLIFTTSTQGRCGEWPSKRSQPSTARAAEPAVEDAGLVERRPGRQALLLAQPEVLLAAARGDVDDARALRLADLAPGDDPVRLAGADRRRPAALADHAGQLVGVAG